MKHLKIAMLIIYVFVLIIFGSLTSNYCNKNINTCKSIESLKCNDYAYYISTSTGVQKISKCEYDTNCLNVKVVGFTLKLNDSLADVINKLKENVREGLSDSFNSMYIRSTHREPRHMNATGREDDSDYEQDDNEEANESMEQEREERDTQSQDMMNRFPTADENDGTMNEF